MKKIIILFIFLCILIFLAGCEVTGGTVYIRHGYHGHHICCPHHHPFVIHHPPIIIHRRPHFHRFHPYKHR